MRRNTLNFLIDAAILLIMLAMVATGLLIRYVLPPGSGGRGGGVSRTLWSLGRHDWGDLHFWLAIGLIGLLVVHLALHWGWVCTTTRRLVGGRGNGVPPGTRMRWLSGAVVTVLIAGAMAAFLWAGARRVETRMAGGDTAEHGMDAVPARHDYAAADGSASSSHGTPDDQVIRGSNTLGEAAATLGISVDRLKQSLGLPDDVSSEERLGRLRRAYGFEMSDVRNAASASR